MEEYLTAKALSKGQTFFYKSVELVVVKALGA